MNFLYKISFIIKKKFQKTKMSDKEIECANSKKIDKLEQKLLKLEQKFKNLEKNLNLLSKGKKIKKRRNNGPKPRSGYNMFVSEKLEKSALDNDKQYKKFLKKHDSDGKKANLKMKYVGELWKKLSEKDKEVFKNKAKNYNKEQIKKYNIEHKEEEEEESKNKKNSTKKTKRRKRKQKKTTKIIPRKKDEVKVYEDAEHIAEIFKPSEF